MLGQFTHVALPVGQVPSGHMRTVVVMAMKATLVDTPQPVDAQLHQLMPGMLNYMQDQDRSDTQHSKHVALCSGLWTESILKSNEVAQAATVVTASTIAA